MAKTLQLLRGTTAQNNSFTGHVGELTVDTTTNELRLHDGSTAGGHVIPNKAFLGGGTAGTLLTNSGTPGTVNATSIDATPTDGSNNPVSSDGVYDALATKADTATTLSGYGITDGANTALSNLTTAGEERVFQPGMVMPFASSTVPSGWLKCDGSAVSRTTYADLFAAIGTAFGVGDGSTTFNLPETTDGRVIAGSGAAYIGTTTEGMLPNIKGQIENTTWTYAGMQGNTGPFTKSALTGSYGATGSAQGSRITFNASAVSNLYQDAATQVRAASLFMYYIIKY